MRLTNRPVRIATRPVGQHFACLARVYDGRTGRVIHETREHPYGYDSEAYAAAYRWAREQGFEVAHGEEG